MNPYFAAAINRLFLLGFAEKLVERGLRVARNDEPFFLRAALERFPLGFRSFSHVQSSSRFDKRVAVPGIGPGRVLSHPRDCKSRASAYFATRPRTSLDVAAGSPVNASPAATRFGPSSGGHESVTHSQREYVRPGTDVHSNTIEGVFSLLKRGVMGTFHSVSRKHLPNYLNEFEFRWNTRKVDDGQRVVKAIRQVEGKRLMYRESVDNPPYLPAVRGQAPAPFEK